MSLYDRKLVDFSLTVAKHFLQDGEEINYSVSPTSIYLALAMIHIGAKNDSSRQLEKLLGVDISSLILPRTQESELFVSLKETYDELCRSAEIDNMLFSECHLRENYKRILINTFKATFEHMSFHNSSEVVEVINKWVREQTDNRIYCLIDESAISPETVLILVNTIYFKSMWKSKFDEKLTHIDQFHLASFDTVNVPFMAKKDTFKIFDDGEARYRALSLEFEQENYTAVFLLPNAHLSTKQLVSSLQVEDLQRILRNSEYCEVIVDIPKFKLDTNTKMKKILQDLGVTDIFDLNKADLTSMSACSLCVEDIIHRSTVEIDENGVISAAATAIDFREESLEIEECFIIDRPFLFLIIDQKSGIPLFINIIYDPSLS